MVEEKADSEPEFQYIPEKCPQDPTQIDQHALRDSMVTLKEGLSSGAILAQFDVRGTLQLFNDIFISTCNHVLYCLLTATVQEEAGDDDAVCQITSECFQKSLQRHLPMYGFSSTFKHEHFLSPSHMPPPPG